MAWFHARGENNCDVFIDLHGIGVCVCFVLHACPGMFPRFFVPLSTASHMHVHGRFFEEIVEFSCGHRSTSLRQWVWLGEALLLLRSVVTTAVLPCVVDESSSFALEE